MIRRTLKLIDNSLTGIILLIICWTCAFMSLLLVMSLEQTENNLQTLFLPNKDENIFYNYRTKRKNIEIKNIIKEPIEALHEEINHTSNYMIKIAQQSMGNSELLAIITNKKAKLIEENIKSAMEDISYNSSEIKNSVSIEFINGSEPISSKGISSVSTSENKPLFVTIYDVETNSTAPGENGTPYYIDKTKLSPEEKFEYEKGWKNHEFNLFVSDRISVRRSIPDRRSEICKKEINHKKLSSTSIIIVFHNEAWSTLLRTVHSIIDRSPSELIQEIILVDDASTLDHLGKPLESYISLLKKVKIKRTISRLGLMKARIFGAAETTGDVLTFLDAHIECYPGWLEPLLSRIAESETNVVCPVIDSISDDTFEPTFLTENNLAVGVFDWAMQFDWKFPSQLKRNITNYNSPIRSPTMAGGLFSIKRSYFYRLGTYDAGMKIWGSENIEMSFRIWMCGGTLEIIPCSHVGHVYRKTSPYNWGESIDKILVINQRRLVDVWLDEYKEIYYAYTGNRNKYDRGEILARLTLKKKLKCKSFTWYLKNIYPELYNPLEGQFIGAIQSMSLKGSCIDAVGKDSKSPSIFPCHYLGGNQLWMITQEGYLRNLEKCLFGSEFHLISCVNVKGNSWKYNREDLIIYDSHGNCLTLFNQELVSKKCSASPPDINQKWNLKSSENFKMTTAFVI